MLLSTVGVNMFYICFIVYLYGDLAIYAAAVPVSLMEVAWWVHDLPSCYCSWHELMEHQLYVLNVKIDLFHISCRSRKLISHKTPLISYGRRLHISLFEPMQTFVCHHCGIFFGPFFIAPVCHFNSLVCTDKLQKSHQNTFVCRAFILEWSGLHPIKSTSSYLINEFLRPRKYPHDPNLFYTMPSVIWLVFFITL